MSILHVDESVLIWKILRKLDLILFDPHIMMEHKTEQVRQPSYSQDLVHSNFFFVSGIQNSYQTEDLSMSRIV